MGAGETFHAMSTSVAEVALEGPLLIVRVKPATRLDAAGMQEVIRAMALVTGGRAHPVLGDVRNIVSVDHAARQIPASSEGARLFSRLALLVSTPASRVIGNFYLFVTKPRYPTRLFDDEPTARDWLLSGVKPE